MVKICGIIPLKPLIIHAAFNRANIKFRKAIEIRATVNCELRYGDRFLRTKIEIISVFLRKAPFNDIIGETFVAMAMMRRHSSFVLLLMSSSDLSGSLKFDSCKCYSFS